MKKSVIKTWDKNLDYLVKKLIQGVYTIPEIERHCRDFLKSYRGVCLDILKEEVREEYRKQIIDLCIQEQCIEIEKTKPNGMNMTDMEYAESCGKSYMAVKVLTLLNKKYDSK